MHFLRFRTKLMLIYFVIAFTASFVVAWFTFASERRMVREEARRAVEETARQVAYQLDGALDQMTLTLNHLIANPRVISSIRTLSLNGRRPFKRAVMQEARNTLLREIRSTYVSPNTYRLLFYNLDGELFATATPLNQRMVSSFRPEDIPWLEEADASLGRNILVAPHEDVWVRQKPEVMFSMVKALQGENLGYMEVDSLASRLDPANAIPSDYNLVLFYPDATIFYQRNPGGVQPEIFHRELQHNGDALTWSSYTPDNRQLAAFSRLQTYPMTVMIVRSEAGRPTAGFFARPYPGLLAVLILAVTLITIHLLMRNLLKPINQMQAMMERTTLENLSQPILSKRSDYDEIRAFMDAYQQMMDRLKTSIRNEKTSELLRLQAQFDTLQAQVNPHFIYNVLNIINARGVENNDDLTCECCGSLADMLRYATDNANRYASLADEMEHLQKYIFLLDCRWKEKIRIRLAIPERLMTKILPKLTLQQLVENAVQHAFGQHEGVMAITLEGAVEGRDWILRVCDNGDGFSEAALADLQMKMADIRETLLSTSQNLEQKIGGMGLVNTYARLWLLYNDSFSMRAWNCDLAGACVEIRIREAEPPTQASN